MKNLTKRPKGSLNTYGLKKIIKKREVIYKVHSLDFGSSISTYIPMGIYRTKAGDLFCDVMVGESSDRKPFNFYRSEISLQDANVIENAYNDHFAFSSEIDAMDYLKQIKGA